MDGSFSTSNLTSARTDLGYGASPSARRDGQHSFRDLPTNRSTVTLPPSPSKLSKFASPSNVSEIEFKRSVETIFAQMDINGDGVLTWNNQEILRFVHAVFARHGWAVPTWGDSEWYALYRHFDKDGRYNLDREECWAFAKTIRDKCFASNVKQQADSGLESQLTNLRIQVYNLKTEVNFQRHRATNAQGLCKGVLARRTLSCLDELSLKTAFTVWANVNKYAAQVTQRILEKMRFRVRGEELVRQLDLQASKQQTRMVIQSIFLGWGSFLAQQRAFRVVSRAESRVAESRRLNFLEQQRLKSQASKARADIAYYHNEQAKMLIQMRLHLLVRHTYGAWLAATRHLQLESVKFVNRDERERLGYLAEAQMLKLVSMLQDACGAISMRRALRAWHWTHVEMKREKARRARSEASRKAVVFLEAHKIEDLLHHVISYWSGGCMVQGTRKQLTSLEARNYWLRKKWQSHSKWVLRALVKWDEGAGLRQAFADWMDAITQLKTEEAHQKFINFEAQLKAKGDLAIMMTLRTVFTHFHEAALHTTFSVWSDILAQARLDAQAEKIRLDTMRQKLNGEAYAQRAIAQLVGHWTLMSGQCILAAWSAYIDECRVDKEVELLCAKAKGLGEEHEQAIWNTAHKIFGWHTNDLLRTILTAWWHDAADGKHGRELEAHWEAHSKNLARTEEAAHRAGTMLIGAQGNLIVKNCVNGWCRIVRQIREDHAVASLKADHDLLKEKTFQSACRHLAQRCDHNSEVLMHGVVSSWKDVVERVNHRVTVEGLRREKLVRCLNGRKGAKGVSTRYILAIWANETAFIRKVAFTEWYTICCKNKQHWRLHCLRLEKIKRDAIISRAIKWFWRPRDEETMRWVFQWWQGTCDIWKPLKASNNNAGGTSFTKAVVEPDPTVQGKGMFWDGFSFDSLFAPSSRSDTPNNNSTRSAQAPSQQQFSLRDLTDGNNSSSTRSAPPTQTGGLFRPASMTSDQFRPASLDSSSGSSDWSAIQQQKSYAEPQQRSREMEVEGSDNRGTFMFRFPGDETR